MSGPDRLKAWREEQGISMTEAARRLDEKWWNYRRYESGEREPPLVFLVAAQDVCGIDVKDWLPARPATPSSTDAA